MKQRLISALQKCADAHHVECVMYSEDEMTFMAVSVPLLADLRMIAEAFFGKTMCVVDPDHSWGYTAFALGFWPMRKEVDEELLKLALPYGTDI